MTVGFQVPGFGVVFILHHVETTGLHAIALFNIVIINFLPDVMYAHVLAIHINNSRPVRHNIEVHIEEGRVLGQHIPEKGITPVTSRSPESKSIRSCKARH